MALFGGTDVLHVTATGASSNQVLEYSQAWIQRDGDQLRLDINDERRTGDIDRPDTELIVEGLTYAGLGKDTIPVDPLAALLPLEHFTLVTPDTASEVSITERDGSTVLQRSYPETTHIETQCALDVRLEFDARTSLPTRVEQESFPCSFQREAPSQVATADLTYEPLAPADLPAGFFDPQALQAAFLSERLERVRQRPMPAYWLGTERLADIWPQIDPSARSAARFWYGEDGTELMIESWPSDVNFAERCPLREGPGGVVVGEIGPEPVSTAFGPAEFCPSDGWLRLMVENTRIYIWPGPQKESKEELVAIANQLRPVA